MSEFFSTEDKGGYINIKRNCPHAKVVKELPIITGIEKLKCACLQCGDTSENWMCLSCHSIYCGRYIKGHMKEHGLESGHCCTISFSDLNTWCYPCNAYVTSPEIVKIYQTFHLAKFGSLPSLNMEITSFPEAGPELGVTETQEAPEVTLSKAFETAALFNYVKNLVVFTGAGISTSANIPDFRGPNGVWTMKAKGVSAAPMDLKQAEPTYCHKALANLMKHMSETDGGKRMYIISQNIDGLHRRSGIPPNALSELHGNVYIETCWGCGREYFRDHIYNKKKVSDNEECKECLARVPCHCHCTTNKCECGMTLKDSIIHFGEDLPKDALERAFESCRAADLCIILGSSLVVSPANQLPMETLMRGGKLVIVNMQPTAFDTKAHIRSFSKVDDFMYLFMQQLKIPVAK